VPHKLRKIATGTVAILLGAGLATGGLALASSSRPPGDHLVVAVHVDPRTAHAGMSVLKVGGTAPSGEPLAVEAIYRGRGVPRPELYGGVDHTVRCSGTGVTSCTLRVIDVATDKVWASRSVSARIRAVPTSRPSITAQLAWDTPPSAARPLLGGLVVNRYDGVFQVAGVATGDRLVVEFGGRRLPSDLTPARNGASVVDWPGRWTEELVARGARRSPKRPSRSPAPRCRPTPEPPVWGR